MTSKNRLVMTVRVPLSAHPKNLSEPTPLSGTGRNQFSPVAPGETVDSYHYGCGTGPTPNTTMRFLPFFFASYMAASASAMILAGRSGFEPTAAEET
jgi:hypothetical protein